MPCSNSNHEHAKWPEGGEQEFVIESCETRCGWCKYETKSANNLRVHARRHIANENETSLKGIKVGKGKAGRKRVQMERRRFPVPEARNGESHPPMGWDRWDELIKTATGPDDSRIASEISRSESQRPADAAHQPPSFDSFSQQPTAFSNLGHNAENQQQPEPDDTTAKIPFDDTYPGVRSPRGGRRRRAIQPEQPDTQSGASTPTRHHQSTSSLPNRDYILSLADPDYILQDDHQNRVPKHPATFKCTLCDKRFSRAYNLRSHLRTHTDERPFACTVCGKAFAKQHDRKRHEGLHSGEKKFVCMGELKGGSNWGCGRRFARADQLGRHLRSESGLSTCIKPLLEEEAIEQERQNRLLQEPQVQNSTQHQQPIHDSHFKPNDRIFHTRTSGWLPAALLAQYPALATTELPELPSELFDRIV